MSNNFFDNININISIIVSEFNNYNDNLNILFDNLNELKQINILEKLIDYNKYYQLNNYYIVFEFIVLKIIKNYNKYKHLLTLKLFKLLCELKSTQLLYKLNFAFTKDNINKSLLFDLVTYTSYKCSLNNFIFIFEKYINYDINNQHIHIMELNKNNNNQPMLNRIINEFNINNILCKSLFNIDDRIYKFLLDNYINKSIIENNNLFIILIINNLSKLRNPSKYILRKFKYLSKYINFNNFIDIIIHDFNDIQIIYYIHKFYYNKAHDFNIINNIFNSNYDIIYYNKIYDLLLTEEEKIIFKLIFKLKNNIELNNIELNNKKILEKIIINNYKNIIILLSNNNINNNKNIINILRKNNLLNLYFEQNIALIDDNNIKLLLFTKFFII